MDFNEAVDFGVTADSGERMDFDGALDFLEQRSGLGSVMGLDSIRNLLRELSDPQKDLEFVHIAGTNGKGSVSACLSSILKEAGCRTGTYTSPAVISVRERYLSLIHISEPTRLLSISYAVFCLKKNLLSFFSLCTFCLLYTSDAADE